MRRKNYDDDQLIALLADPDCSHGQIADHLGLSRRMLQYIVQGVYRKDLRPRIREAGRERLRRRRGGTTCEAVPRGEAYNDDEMVAMLAQGEKTTGQIARHFGISRDMVWRIATGRRRPDLHQRVREIIEEARAMVHRQAAASLEALLRRHIEVGLTGTGETARKCREFVLGLFLDPARLGPALCTPPAPSAIQRDLATVLADDDTARPADEGPAAHDEPLDNATPDHHLAEPRDTQSGTRDAAIWSLSDVARRAKSDARGRARSEAKGGDAALDRTRMRQRSR